MNKGFVHKLAVLCKDYYVIRTISDLFIFAGAEGAWSDHPATASGSERVDHFYGWIEGIKKHAPDQLEKILTGVATQVVDDDRIPAGDRVFIKRYISPGLAETQPDSAAPEKQLMFPKDVEQLLERLIKGLPRAMHPLKYRRKGLPSLEFDNEYDVQSLFHALLRPWINDIRVEEYTPSYAGSSTRIDFLLAKYQVVVEIKIVRDAKHGKSVGDELLLDIAHYRTHPDCSQLWIVIFDPNGYIPNSDGLKADLDDEYVKKTKSVSVKVKTFILSI